MTSLDRRTFLQALGLGALASTGLFAGSARASEAPRTVRRLLVYVSSHGTIPEASVIRGGHSDREDYELPLAGVALPPILAPLAGFADRLLVLDGIGNGAAIAEDHLEGHGNGSASILTGCRPQVPAGDVPRPWGPSLDQVVAAARATPFPSLEWAVGGNEVAYDAEGRPLPVEEDPLRAWERLGGSAATGDAPEGLATWQERAASLAASRFARLGRRLGGADGAKLDQHGALLGAAATRSAEVAALDAPLPDAPALEAEFGDADYPEERVEAFLDLAAAAFAGGLTDVITLRVGTMFPETLGAPPCNLHLDVAHQVAHDPEAAAIMTDYHTWHAERVASLLARLDAIPEGDGTVLDHTLVVWTNEMATGGHHFADLPVVIAGGTGVLRTGRVVRWGPRSEIAGASREWIGQPHQRLLATLATALGVPCDAFGEVTLPGARGDVDATGLLDRVLA